MGPARRDACLRQTLTYICSFGFEAISTVCLKSTGKMAPRACPTKPRCRPSKPRAAIRNHRVDNMARSAARLGARSPRTGARGHNGKSHIAETDQRSPEEGGRSFGRVFTRQGRVITRLSAQPAVELRVLPAPRQLSCPFCVLLGQAKHPQATRQLPDFGIDPRSTGPACA